ncbi:cation:proton antiporter [Desulfurococcaceae archaeon MEX13E-LK6-19]|nr:cation:proton antiporter [Desulfurococcaceae archaeon MEX13E-LK6-19]
MAVEVSIVLGLSSIAPMAFAFSLPLLGKIVKNRVIETIYFIVATGIVFILNTIIAYKVFVENIILVYPFGGWPPPLGIAYIADKLSALLGFITALTIFVVSLYIQWYSRHMENYLMLYTLVLILEAGFMGFLYTSDVFNIYVMLEVIGLSTYPLVAFYSHKRKALVAAARYAILAATITALYFFSTVLLYGVAGTLNMGCLALKARNITMGSIGDPFFNNEVYGPMFYFTFYLAMALWTSFLISALFPNHFWLPDAHSEAPSPISAILSGLAVNMGVYFFMRITYTVYNGGVFARELVSVRDITLLLASIATFYGALMMGFEDDVKRILAYSTVMNIGFIYMGISLGTILGVTAGLYHLMNHAIGKTLAFIAIGVFVRRYRTRNIRALEGVGHVYPLAMFALIAGFLHLIGLPPFGGFFSKVLLFQALVEANNYAVASVLIVSTVASSYGYLRVLEHLWHMPFPSKIIKKERLSLSVKTVILVLILWIIMLGFLQSTLVDILNDTSRQLLRDYTTYITALYTLYKNMIPPGITLP